MNFDVRAAVARLKSRNVKKPGSILAIDQAVSQFNGLLKAAKEKYPDRVDIQTLIVFDSLNSVDPKLWQDAVNRLLDALDVAPDESKDHEPQLSMKFGILRAELQIEKDFDVYLNDHGGLGLLFFDVDHFKDLNTKYTETIVDRDILAPFQHFLINVLQSRGFGYHVGGDEFIILLRNADYDETKAFASRLLSAVQKQKFIIEGNEETLTVSIGMACYPKDSERPQELREMANKAENRAKSDGRNRLVCWPLTDGDD